MMLLDNFKKRLHIFYRFERFYPLQWKKEWQYWEINRAALGNFLSTELVSLSQGMGNLKKSFWLVSLGILITDNLNLSE